MKNPNIAKVLKEYRKQNHYSVEDVVFKLEEQNLPFATKTIYGWESGQTQPDADTLLVLCKIYKIDNILETFGYQPPSEELLLSKEEHELIQKYRQHEEKLVCGILTPTLLCCGLLLPYNCIILHILLKILRRFPKTTVDQHRLFSWIQRVSFFCIIFKSSSILKFPSGQFLKFLQWGIWVTCFPV